MKVIANFLKREQQSEKIFYDEKLIRQPLRAMRPNKSLENTQNEADHINVKMSKDELVLLTMNN